MSIFNTYMETDHLLIRNMKKLDEPFLLTHFTSEYMCGKLSYLNTEKSIKDFISWSNQKHELIKQNRWIILDKVTNIPIGTVGFNSILRNEETADLGFELAKSQWGKGYTKEVMEKILLFTFKKLMLKELTIEIPAKCHSIHSNLLIMGFEEMEVYEYGQGLNSYSKSYGLKISNTAYVSYLNRSEILRAHNYRRLVTDFHTLNVIDTKDYYVDYLGFTCLTDINNDDTLAKIQKDDIEINIRKVKTAHIRPNHILYNDETLNDAYFIVSNINLLYNEIEALKINIIIPLSTKNNVNQHFVIEDIDGRYICFTSIE